MPCPRKIPIETALETLNNSNRGYSQTERLRREHLLVREFSDGVVLGSTDGLTVRVADLYPFFATPKDFKVYKQQLQFSPEHWSRVHSRANSKTLKRYARKYELDRSEFPCRSRSSSVASPRRRRGRPRKSPRRRSTSPARRTRSGRYKIKSKLGRMSREERDSADDDESVLSIRSSNDECDDTDVNLPIPVCQGIRRVCRNYDRNRRYTDFPRDPSEDKNYIFEVGYEN